MGSGYNDIIPNTGLCGGADRMSGIAEDLMEIPECMCCPMMDLCTVPPGTIIRPTKEDLDRCNCLGLFMDAMEPVT